MNIHCLHNRGAKNVVHLRINLQGGISVSARPVCKIIPMKSKTGVILLLPNGLCICLFHAAAVTSVYIHWNILLHDWTQSGSYHSHGTVMLVYFVSVCKHGASVYLPFPQLASAFYSYLLNMLGKAFSTNTIMWVSLVVQALSVVVFVFFFCFSFFKCIRWPSLETALVLPGRDECVET